jgi:hypothetical protein
MKASVELSFSSSSFRRQPLELPHTAKATWLTHLGGLNNPTGSRCVCRNFSHSCVCPVALLPPLLLLQEWDCVLLST